MNTPLLAFALPPAIPGVGKKKRVLLVDSSARKRELRAEILRRLGIEVDCAADINEARSWWRADLYNLVLIDLENDAGRDEFCRDLRSSRSPQQIAFLVGKPEYLANTPNTEDASSGQPTSALILQKETAETRSADVSGTQPHRWGILEASQRISAVRSASQARLQAIRERPAPSRDLEPRYAKRPATETRTLDELLGEAK
ncbi:MAG TPA: response regulator [Terriglobales bacterium]|nr:response regulator [Terriglobales bacterium]